MTRLLDEGYCSLGHGELKLLRLIPVALLSDGIDFRTHPDKQAALQLDHIDREARPCAGAFLQLSGPSRAGPLLLELHGKAPMCRPQQQATAATTNTPSSTTVHAAKVVKTKQDDEVSIAVELASQGSVPAAHLRQAWSHRVMPATY